MTDMTGNSIWCIFYFEGKYKNQLLLYKRKMKAFADRVVLKYN